MTGTKKCAHDGCSCVVEKGKFCSQRCEDSKKRIELVCQCGHPQCAEQSLRA